jgi:hypothetical protein
LSFEILDRLLPIPEFIVYPEVAWVTVPAVPVPFDSRSVT